MLSKCLRCGGALYTRYIDDTSCLNCGHQPRTISKDVKAEVAISKGFKKMIRDIGRHHLRFVR